MTRGCVNAARTYRAGTREPARLHGARYCHPTPRTLLPSTAGEGTPMEMFFLVFAFAASLFIEGYRRISRPRS